MHPKLESIRNAATGVWTSARASRFTIWILWVAGLALGAVLFAAALRLPLYAAVALWLATLGAGLLQALRAEPVLDGVASRTQEQRKTEPPPPPEPPRVPALLKMVPVGGGLFRMGSPPATVEEIEEYTAQWVEAFGGEPEEQRKGLGKY